MTVKIHSAHVFSSSGWLFTPCRVFLKTDVWHGFLPQLTPHHSAKWRRDIRFFYEDIIGAKFEFFPMFYHGMALQSMHIFLSRV